MEFRAKGSEETFYATIHMAGDIGCARRVIRDFVMRGACVQLAPATYIYTGGLEEGFTARVIQYPRFPKSKGDIYEQVRELADRLANQLSQISFTIETSEQTTYFQADGFDKRS